MNHLHDSGKYDDNDDGDLCQDRMAATDDDGRHDDNIHDGKGDDDARKVNHDDDTNYPSIVYLCYLQPFSNYPAPVALKLIRSAYFGKRSNPHQIDYRNCYLSYCKTEQQV